MEAIVFFWGSISALFLLIFILMRESESLALFVSGICAVIIAYFGADFYQSAIVFLTVFLFLNAVNICTRLVYKAVKCRAYIKRELMSGKRYGYVCETIYPDIPGKVLIGGEIFSASSNGVFYHGDVVLCTKPREGKTFVHIVK